VVNTFCFKTRETFLKDTTSEHKISISHVMLHCLVSGNCNRLILLNCVACHQMQSLNFRKTRKDLASWSCVWQRMLVCFAIEIKANCVGMIQGPQSLNSVSSGKIL
jgi:hypothetical protein